MLKKIDELKVDYLVADLGYFDAEDQKTAQLEHDVAVVTKIKKNTIVPEHCSPKGRPECEQGHTLVFDGFDKDTNTAWFRGDDSKCSACPLQDLCDKKIKHKKVPIRTTERVKKWFILRDALRLIEGMIQHVRATILSPNHVGNSKGYRKFKWSNYRYHLQVKLECSHIKK